MSAYDVAIIGTGGVGSATLYNLAKAGTNVIGIDRYAPPHNHGSSHGQTRVIRMAYFEHPDYVPLLRKAYEAWNHLEQVSQRKLYFPTGVLQTGPEDGEVIAGIRRSAEEHQLAIESFSEEEISKTFPGVSPPPGSVGLLEQNAGYLLVSDCIEAYLSHAKSHGATLELNTTVNTWLQTNDEFEIRTSKGHVRAKQLIVTSGAWSKQLLADIKVPMTILRKHLYWYDNRAPQYHRNSRFPVFLFETPAGIYYGFPQIDQQGVKLARHDLGEVISTATDQSLDEDLTDRSSVEEFAKTCLPLLSNQLIRREACMYTMTPDHHFLVGTHPDQRGLHFAAGLSGHGFKFVSALGEILSDLALHGVTDSPIDFLSPQRFY